MYQKIASGRTVPFLLVAVLAILAAVGSLSGGRRTAREISDRPAEDSLALLLREAETSFKRGRFFEAHTAFRQALEIDPLTPHIKTKLRKAEEILISKADELAEAGNDRDAADIAKKIIKLNPDNPRIRKIAEKYVKPSQGSAAWSWKPADLDDPAATPANILPPELPGYKITQSGWLKKPHQGGATYFPRSPSVAKEIDRVFLTVEKYGNDAGAKEALDRERQLFSVRPQLSPINNHPAAFSLYQEPNPDVFPILASLNWTRGNWYFSLQVVPLIDRRVRTQPSTEFKRGIAMDVARKLGY